MSNKRAVCSLKPHKNEKKKKRNTGNIKFVAKPTRKHKAQELPSALLREEQ